MSIFDEAIKRINGEGEYKFKIDDDLICYLNRYNKHLIFEEVHDHSGVSVPFLTTTYDYTQVWVGFNTFYTFWKSLFKKGKSQAAMEWNKHLFEVFEATAPMMLGSIITDWEGDKPRHFAAYSLKSFIKVHWWDLEDEAKRKKAAEKTKQTKKTTKKKSK